MKLASFASIVASIGMVLCAPTARAEDAPTASMKLLDSGAMPKLGGYRPQRVTLSAEKPAELKKAPELAAPLYGSIKFGEKSYLIVLDEPEGKDSTLYIDANNNGDITDDEAPKWTKARGNQYSGTMKLPISAGDKPTMVSLGVYRFDKNDPQRAALKSFLFYFADYAYEGDITLGGTKYHAMLADDNATGDFRPKAAKPATVGGGGSGIRLLIDLNADGKFSPRGEMFDAAKPFNIKGSSWKLSDMTADGTFKMVKSEEAVDEVLPPPDLSVGKMIPTFKASKMDGKEVNFPADYKGKIVMLDFWATWCGPCMGEVPNLVKQYKQSHDKGIEILGISLDQPNAAEKVKTVTADNGMTWPQVYDGGFWKAKIAEQFGIQSIPAAFLVDGDTGEILAAGDSLRGDNLAGTYEAALAKKTAAAKK